MWPFITVTYNNHLPNTVRSAPTYLSFRKSLKTYFLNQAFPTEIVFPVLI